MKVLVIGRTGQVAHALQRQCPDGWQITALGRQEADLADPEACARAVRDYDADAVINAAAYTAVERAEDEEALATIINGASPGAMAAAAAAKGVPFLHISTDYVFDGEAGRPWRVDDPTQPRNAYGRSKLEGEKSVRAAGGQHVILRTSWVFSERGANFVKAMLKHGASKNSLNVVSDQVGGPTPAEEIAVTLLKMANALRSGAGASGTFHFSGKPDVSWADFARAIFARANMDVHVVDISSVEYPTKAQRPANSKLDGSRLMATYSIDRPDWRAGLEKVLQELGDTR